ncbi:FRG domain-containing protein [Aeromonas veronii]|uniref:FRG domain-containing protein n=1 Tax=Aeromonas veronii TaxID=654 RepID=UPI00191DD26C|nr:FRG domain-containing protein [Aeromonas veronii]MBL0487842.1 FRG domain-containing protein [Aeromonas veronii]
MVRKPRWESCGYEDGVEEIRLTSWKYFSDFINQEMLDYTTYVYRGHGNSQWKLEPTLDRIIKSPVSSVRKEHLEKFIYETRGRRGANPPILKDENDWWALGQHHGLATPLLDWTEAPFVAFYFAAAVAEKEKCKSFSVFALSQAAVESKNAHIRQNSSIALVNGQKPTVKIFRPLSDENTRLVNQRGLFTRGPNNVDLERWVKKFPPETPMMELIKITIPNSDIKNCLRYLNRMNINHATLFPDLLGASEFCNAHLKIPSY